MHSKRPRVLALDLEGTLISNAMSQIARPGLFEFLSRCHELFPRVVMFTTVGEERFRAIAQLLVDEGAAPSWFAHIEYVSWQGETKDLNFIPESRPQDARLVDDFESYVHPGQKPQWLQIDCFEHPYEATDRGLAKMLTVIEQVVVSA
jgi:hypothetical protein